jgi:kynurenine formamidase
MNIYIYTHTHAHTRARTHTQRKAISVDKVKANELSLKSLPLDSSNYATEDVDLFRSHDLFCKMLSGGCKMVLVKNIDFVFLTTFGS